MRSPSRSSRSPLREAPLHPSRFSFPSPPLTPPPSKELRRGLREAPLLEAPFVEGGSDQAPFLVHRVLYSFVLVSLIGLCDHLSRAPLQSKKGLKMKTRLILCNVKESDCMRQRGSDMLDSSERFFASTELRLISTELMIMKSHFW